MITLENILDKVIEELNKTKKNDLRPPSLGEFRIYKSFFPGRERHTYRITTSDVLSEIEVRKIDEAVFFWSIVLNPEFCKVVFEDWASFQLRLLEMRNQNKTIDEVLEYIEQNTILELSAT